MFKTKRKFRSRADEIRASHSDFVSSTVANVIKHKPMLLPLFLQLLQMLLSINRCFY